MQKKNHENQSKKTYVKGVSAPLNYPVLVSLISVSELGSQRIEHTSSPEFSKNFEYKIIHIPKTRNRKNREIDFVSVSEHCTYFGTNVFGHFWHFLCQFSQLRHKCESILRFKHSRFNLSPSIFREALASYHKNSKYLLLISLVFFREALASYQKNSKYLLLISLVVFSDLIIVIKWCNSNNSN